ncbi:hypothetical protein [Bauldia sp.]|uniref:hypothetical protein n=1 Tax=Bauldia sp. TaxID=2575872 RepID=UPI003BAA60C4
MAIGLVFTVPAVSGEIVDQAARAETLLSRGYAAPALSAFDRSADAFWVQSPLQLSTAVFADAVEGYANYTPRSDAPFETGETMTIYLEPFGFAYMATGDAYQSAVAADIEIRTPGGLILAKSDDFVRLEWQGRTQRHEVHASIALPLPPLKPGAYLIELTLRDENSDKTVMTELPFSIAEQPAPGSETE